MKSLRLEVIFGAKNKLSPALKVIVGSSNAASKALKNTRDELKKLNDQQKKVDGYVKHKKVTEESAKALKDVQDRIKSLRQEMVKNPSDKLTKDFEKAIKEAKKLKEAHSQNQTKLQSLRNELKQTGITTGNLADHQVELSKKINSSNASIDSQKKKLENLNRIQQSTQKMASNARTVGMYGVGAAATGVGAMYSMRRPIDETKRMDITENRIGALGLGKEATKEATQYARAMKTYGTSTLDNMSLMLDGVTAFADVHHAKMVAPTLAKMKFGNEAMFGAEQGAENERLFMDMLKVIELRNGLKSEAAFNKQANIIQQVVTATGGRVQAPEWLNAIKTGGIAVKGLTDEAFYYKMEPIVQELGGHRYGTAAMSAYQNIYQGRTTKRAANNMERLGLIADPSKLKHDKAGQISFLDVGAIKGAELFKKDQFAWMEKVLLPELAKKGITERGQIHDAIGSIFTNRTASSLFSTMYDQREQIHKNMKLNAGAENIDQLSERAKTTTTGKELEFKSKLHDAYLTFGTTVLPIYTRAVEMATGAMQAFSGWMQQNPTLAKIMGVGLLGIATSLIVIGGALAVFSPLILGMLSLRLIMASTTGAGSALSFMFKGLISPVKWIGSLLLKSLPLLKWTGSAFLTVGRYALLASGRIYLFAIKGLGLLASGIIRAAIFGLQSLGSALLFVGRMALVMGRFLLANPILIAVAAIAGVAYLIYKNWGPVSGFFIDLWTQITGIFAPIGAWFGTRITEAKTAFSGGIQGMSALILNWSPIGLFYAAFAKVMSWFGIELPAKFTGFGGMLIDGLVNGIKSGFSKLKTIWAEVTSYIPSYFKSEQKIKSPSRVMAGLGGHIMSGLGVGLQNGFPDLKARFADVVGIFSPNTSDVMQKINVAPALAKIRQSHAQPAAAGGGAVTIQGDTITMHIHAQPGQSVQQLAQMVANVLDQRDRQKMQRARDRYQDSE